MKENISLNHKSSKALVPMYPNVAGIDIGSRSIFVAIPGTQGVVVREFGSTTPKLREIAGWLKEAGTTSVAMEATGIYWIPLFEVLADNGLNPILVDAKSVKNVPGRKTDVIDCQWIQKLHSCGLLRAAFRPPKDAEAVRAYMRQRQRLIQEQSTEVLRMEKSMLQMNIQLNHTIASVVGATGMAIVRAIVGGERDPKKLALLRDERCKKSEKEFEEALDGNFQESHIFILKQCLKTYDFYEAQIKECDERIYNELQKWETKTKEPPPLCEKDKKKSPLRSTRKKKLKKHEYSFDMRAILFSKVGVDLTAIPGISAQTAAIIIAELGGCDVSAFRNEKAFSSWLGICPGNNVSGGKSLGGHSKKCRNRIKDALCQSVMSLHNSKTALGEFFRHKKSLLGPAKATKAAAHKQANLVYRMLKFGTIYVERGLKANDEQYKKRRLKNLERNARESGFELTPLKPTTVTDTKT